MKKGTIILEQELYCSLLGFAILCLDPIQYLTIYLKVSWFLFYLNKCLVIFLWGITRGDIEAKDICQHQYVLDLLDIFTNLSCECRGQRRCVS